MLSDFLLDRLILSRYEKKVSTCNGAYRLMELVDCPCTGATLPRFVQPAILAVLTKGELHGYLIVQQLGKTSLFSQNPPDATGVYRILKTMEHDGSLKSVWDTKDSGPARRLYTITDRGRHCLLQWGQTLKKHQDFIRNLRDFVEGSCADFTLSDMQEKGSCGAIPWIQESLS